MHCAWEKLVVLNQNNWWPGKPKSQFLFVIPYCTPSQICGALGGWSGSSQVGHGACTAEGTYKVTHCRIELPKDVAAAGHQAVKDACQARLSLPPAALAAKLLVAAKLAQLWRWWKSCRWWQSGRNYGGGGTALAAKLPVAAKLAAAMAVAAKPVAA